MRSAMNNGRQEAFIAFMEKVLEDREVRAMLLLILPLPSRERRAQLDQLQLHRSCSTWAMNVEEIFDFLADDLFATEVFGYLRSARSSPFPEADHAMLPPPCGTKVIIEGKVVECLEERPLCSHSFSFGNARFCAHPLRVPAHHPRSTRDAFDDGNGAE